ncbi:hypothetical protein C4577_04160 [Candidatus Parcubacteria bacterium]|nr:MAG: hypothetical protein C4577_04160 [Candidatus Parcubacteria bacterium]
MYAQAGASNIVGVVGQLPMKWIQLNKALDDWLHRVDIVATVDDDIQKCIDVSFKRDIVPQLVVENIAKELFNSPFYLGGPYSGGNTLFAGNKVRISGMVPGAMQLHRNNELRFSNMGKCWLEDVDYCIQHHIKHHGVISHGGYCLVNKFKNNAGGYQTVRTQERRKETVDFMNSKWKSTKCVDVCIADVKAKTEFDIKIKWKKLSEIGQ